MRLSLDWLINLQVLMRWGNSFFLPCTMLTTNTSLMDWGGVLDHCSVQRMRCPQERLLPINILELRVINLALLHWSCHWKGPSCDGSVRHCQRCGIYKSLRGTRSRATQAEVDLILACSVCHLHSGVYNW